MAPILLIDPGHGGIDPGGGSNQYFKEKEMTLQISLYQQRRFQELKVSVAMTRQTDITLTSEDRAAIVRNSGATYCLSNHINSGGGRGAEAIYSIYATSQLPRVLLEDLEAAGMPSRRVYTRTLPENPSQDYYFMHRETGKVETVILEYGFADNNADTQKLLSDWKNLAEAVVRGFCEVINHPYQPPETTVPGTGTPTTPTPESWKLEAVNWLYEQDLLTSEEWRSQLDQPLPLWAEALLLRRLYEKLRG
ncbi:N-acetylmuramoyl-L-alanine amidase [Brevibacillus sp. SYSU BS000544]|uniref:N-acetylmuramoyl-L-alanine amidase n=1 Tax=Brevibacillus sp. SYSU BS000544 TaxID=3416443 RepID=UPI003CE4EF6D